MEDWNRREKEDPDPPAVTELDVLADLIYGNQWTIVSSSEDEPIKSRLDGAPVFFPEGEASWRLVPVDEGA